jgi:oxygen-independent coproporphyrinogen-3 oxidase
MKPMNSAGAAFSLYIHIPYCISKCPYCDFNSHVVSVIPERQYCQALLRELAQHGSAERWEKRPLQTIFFGGGTPSTFSPGSISAILDCAGALFPLEPDCEITLEANPGTVDQAHFAGYRQAGINRISIGIQSFHPRLLKFLGRAHSAEQARAALALTRSTGYENFSCDLIYGNPGETLADLRADLDTALTFEPPHLSLYNLTFEEGTPFHRAYEAGELKPLPEDDEIAMAELVENRLQRAGLERYEISNYAKRGKESRHNVNYWRGGDYLGIGAGAHSCSMVADGAVTRWSNEKNPGRYMDRVEETGSAVVEQESVDGTKAAGEFLFLGLRMIRGVSPDVFRRRFGRLPLQFFPQIADWLEAGLMQDRDGFLSLTRKGLLVANSIFVQLM